MHVWALCCLQDPVYPAHPRLEGLTPVLQMPKLQPIVARGTLSPWQGLRRTLTGAVTTPSSVAPVELGDTGREW